MSRGAPADLLWETPSTPLVSDAEPVGVPSMQRTDWRPEPESVVDQNLLHAASRKEFAGAPVTVTDPVLAADLAQQDAQPQWEYAYRWPGPVVVEPTLGYLVTAPGRLIAESLPYSRHIGWPTAHPRPVVRRVPRLVSLRDTGDTNHYHLFDDVLGRLELLDRLGVAAGWPLLISAALASHPPFVAAVRRSPRLQAREWIVQGPDEPVEAGEVVFVKALPHSRRTLSYAADLLEPPAPTGDRRVLLVRDPARGRHLRQTEVVELCRERAFETVDGDRLSLDEQIALFRQARYVVGPHGAGLVNLLWRRGAACDLLELFPPESSPAHYHWLCTSFGFGYDALRGTGGSTSDGFDVDLSALGAALDRMTGARPGTDTAPAAARDRLTDERRGTDATTGRERRPAALPT